MLVCAVGIVGWGIGTGAMPLPGKLGKLLGRRFTGIDDGEEDGEWVEEDEDGEDEVELD
jgi:hypothetical protein